MKLLPALTAAVFVLGLFNPSPAAAGSRCRVTTDYRGCTLYTEYQCIGRDRHGCLIYDWVVVRRVPPCDYRQGPGAYRSGRHYESYACPAGPGFRGPYYPGRGEYGHSGDYSRGRGAWRR